MTGDASSIAPTSAKLNGTVTPNGLATTWWFEYGTTTRPTARRRPAKSAGSGTTAQDESLSVTGLKVSTTYHFRLVAKNSGGTTFGSDKTFSTSLAPAVVTGARPERGAPHGDRHRHRRPPRTADHLVVRVRHEHELRREDTAKSAGSKAGAAERQRADLTGLKNGTAYHYRLVAKSDAGTTYGIGSDVRDAAA